MPEPSPREGETPPQGSGPPRVGDSLNPIDALDRSDDGWLDRLRDAEEPCALGRIGPYVDVREVGRGGQGVVFQATQPGTGRRIALKRLLGGTFSTRAMRRRFTREVEAAAALDHPGIVTVYGVEEVDGLPLLAMEWIDGKPITEWAQAVRGTQGSRGVRACLRMFLEVCKAVEHAHGRGVLHRDLKPSNVLVDAKGSPRVLDFGLAVRLDAGGAALEATRSDGGYGTPAYASPEQLRLPRVSLDVRTDVYSLGVMLYEMLCGRSPYEGWSSLPELLRAVEQDAPRRLSAGVESLPRELDHLLFKAMAKDPVDRYGTVTELAADVRRHLAGEALVAHPPGWIYTTRKWIARHRGAAAMALVLVALPSAYALHARHLLGVIETKHGVAEAAKERAVRSSEVADRALVDMRAKADELARTLALMPNCVLQAALENPESIPPGYGENALLQRFMRLGEANPHAAPVHLTSSPGGGVDDPWAGFEDEVIE